MTLRGSLRSHLSDRLRGSLRSHLSGRLLVALLAILTLSGCSFSVYDLPLPGGASTGTNPLTIHVKFADVLDLVPDSAVKVNDVSVGKVTSVNLDHGIADVTVQVRRDTDLPANAVASIEQTSLLGEKFVALAAPPTDPSPQRLESGATIPLERSGRNPEVEEVLGALSLVLNGGGVEQLKTIADELTSALSGHEDAARSVLDQVNTLMANLDQNKGAIVDAIDALNRLSASARAQEGTIDATLEKLPGALTSIDQQRGDLVRTLQALAQLGDTGVRVIGASKAATISSVRDLQPTLTELAASGDDLVNALATLPTYPFTDDVVGRDPQMARSFHMGDYMNLSIKFDVDLGDILGSVTKGSLLPPVVNPTQTVNQLLQCLSSGSLTSAACQAFIGGVGNLVTALTQIKAECLKAPNRDTALCKGLNVLPGLPQVGGTPPSSGSSSGAGGLLGGSVIPGLLRATPDLRVHQQGVTLGEMKALYDPTLVALLMPGLADGSTGGGR